MKGKDLLELDISDLENFRYDADRCVGCKGCAWVDHIYMPGRDFALRCPSIARYLFDAYSAYGREKIALALLDKKLNYSPKVQEIVYSCLLCGACDAGCKRNLELEPLLTLEALRAKLVQDGQGPMPGHLELARNIGDSHNRYGKPHKERHEWVPGGFHSDEKASLIYFVGCAASYLDQKIAKDTVRILQASGLSFKLFPRGEEWCCGHVLFKSGQLEKARVLAEHNLEALKKSGATVLVTSCAEGYNTWKVDYPRLLKKSTSDMGYQVMHISELVSQKLKEGALKFNNKVEMKASYHDPCYLGRLGEPWIHWSGKRGEWGITNPPKVYRKCTNGVYEAPRSALSNIPGLELVEFPRMRENTWCCGAGSGMRETFKDFALWTGSERLRELKTVGSGAIISACPRCKENFLEASHVNNTDIKVLDFTEVVSRAIS